MAPSPDELSQQQRDTLSLDEWLAWEKRRLRIPDDSASDSDGDDEGTRVLPGGGPALPEPEPAPSVLVWIEHAK